MDILLFYGFICALDKINVNFESFEEFQGIVSAKW